MNALLSNKTLALIIGLLLLMMPTTATAQTQYVVDSFDDDPGIQSTDLDGSITLREAVMAANLNRPFGDAPAGSDRFFDVIRFSRAFDSKNVLQLNAQLEVMGGMLRIEGRSPQIMFISGQNRHRIFRVTEGAIFSLKSLTLMKGRANSAMGGAILVRASDVSINNVEIVDSLAGQGAGVGIDGFSRVNFTESTIASNWATDSGGGIYGTERAVISLENCTLTRNHANRNGGGVCLDHAGITTDDFMLQLNSYNSTIFDNRTGFGAWITGNGGGVCVLGWPDSWEGKLIFYNTILAGNKRYEYRGTSPDDVAGTFTRNYGANNLIGAATEDDNAVSDGTRGNLVGTHAHPINPRLGSLRIGYNSTPGYGRTRCYVPQSNSPAINAGFNSEVYRTIDQRGMDRIRGGNVDIGSTER